jgi:hypothetical protein
MGHGGPPEAIHSGRCGVQKTSGDDVISRKIPHSNVQYSTVTTLTVHHPHSIIGAKQSSNNNNSNSEMISIVLLALPHPVHFVPAAPSALMMKHDSAREGPRTSRATSGTEPCLRLIVDA